MLKGLACHFVEQGLYDQQSCGIKHRGGAKKLEKAQCRCPNGEGGNKIVRFTQHHKGEVVNKGEFGRVRAQKVLNLPEGSTPSGDQINVFGY